MTGTVLQMLCLAALGAMPVQAQESVVLVDAGGFENVSTYPPGDLQRITDGLARWLPAGDPAQIVPLAGSAYGTVLRRSQTGTDNLDLVGFPGPSNGVLVVEFDARVSDPSVRTLDVMLLPETGSQMASLLGWGTVAGQLCYYDGQAWIPAMDLDAEWHHYQAINYLDGESAQQWDLKVDGQPLLTGLPWRNSFPAWTRFSRLRIGAIRGPAGAYAELDNLVIRGVMDPLPSDELLLSGLRAGPEGLSFCFYAEEGTDYLVEASPSLGSPLWQPWRALAGAGALVELVAAMLAPQEYFRVSTLPPRLPAGYNDGYRGIWFTLGQFFVRGEERWDKYSGGLGTYTANHVPIAYYAPEVNKTFFVYGGTIANQRHLLIMASYYDHRTHQVPRPTLVHDKGGVNDPHDNPTICLDGEGYVWVFISGRGRARPGFKYRSREPYSVASFQRMLEQEFTYPQPKFVPGRGFFHLFTKYTDGRELYWETSQKGRPWSADQKLAGIGGHYQVSNNQGEKIGTFFNRHPGGNVDRRTDLYYVQTEDWGETWTTADGEALSVPLTSVANPARVIDYAAQGKLVYTLDLAFDRQGHPQLLYITSFGHEPGPENDPRDWVLTKWTGTSWESYVVCQSDHNYDFGSLYLGPERWLIIGPTETGPQSYQTGGEMAVWESQDQGRTWRLLRQITRDSDYNHTYARRPVNATDPFFAFWADGNPLQNSPSRLYFSDSTGAQVWQLPYDMTHLMASPQPVFQVSNAKFPRPKEPH